MAAHREAAAHRISVRITISEPLLAQRMISLLSADRGFEIALGRDDGRGRDVVLTDQIHTVRGPSIIIDDGASGLEASDGDVRAVLAPSVDGELLRAAIRVVAAGFAISEADELHRFSDGPSSLDHPPIADDRDIALTTRESEVLGLLAHGASNKFIARALDISVHTAKFHVASVLSKLGARNRADAIAIGIRRGLVLL